MFKFDQSFRDEFKRNWRHLFVGFAVLFFGFCAPAYALPFLYPEVIAEFGWNREQATFLASVKYFTGAVACLVVGRFLDVTGVWIALLASIATGGVALISFLWVDGLNAYYAVGVLLGIAGPGAIVSVFVLVARSFQESQGTATGVALLGTGLGGVVMPIVITWLIAEFGWRVGMAVLSGGIWFVAIPLLVYGLFRLPFAEEDAEAKAKERAENKAGAVKHFQKMVKGANFWLMAFAFFIVTIVDQAFTQHQVLIFSDAGISKATAALAISAIGLLSMPGRILAGNILDKNSNKGLAGLYVTMTVTALLALVIGDPIIIVLFIALRALSHASVMIDGPVMARHCYGTHHLGLLLGIFTATANLGSASGPWLMGRLFDATGSYQITFLLFIVMPLLSAICILQLRPRAWKERANTAASPTS